MKAFWSNRFLRAVPQSIAVFSFVFLAAHSAYALGSPCGGGINICGGVGGAGGGQGTYTEEHVTLTADPSSIAQGDQSLLTWNSSVTSAGNPTSLQAACNANFNMGSGTYDASTDSTTFGPSSGKVYVAPPAPGKTYTVTCMTPGPSGFDTPGSASARVTVNAAACAPPSNPTPPYTLDQISYSQGGAVCGVDVTGAPGTQVDGGFFNGGTIYNSQGVADPSAAPAGFYDNPTHYCFYENEKWINVCPGCGEDTVNSWGWEKYNHTYVSDGGGTKFVQGASTNPNNKDWYRDDSFYISSSGPSSPSCSLPDLTAGSVSPATVTPDSPQTFSVIITNQGGTGTGSVAITNSKKGITSASQTAASVVAIGGEKFINNGPGLGKDNAGGNNNSGSGNPPPQNPATPGTPGNFTDLFQTATSLDANGNGVGVIDIGTYANGPLAANSSNTASITVALPGSAAYLRACADKSSAGDAGVITESNENNNCGPWTQLSTPCYGAGCTPNGTGGNPGGPGAGGTCQYPGITQPSANPFQCCSTSPGVCAATPGVPNVILTATPSSILKGDASKLTWTSTHASSCTSADFATGNAPSNATGVSVSPPATKTYTITCTDGLGNNGFSSAQVTVIAANLSITAVPNPVRKGDPTTVSWGASGNLNSCTVSGPGLSSSALSGSSVVSISAESTYIISCIAGAFHPSASTVVKIIPSFKEF